MGGTFIGFFSELIYYHCVHTIQTLPNIGVARNEVDICCAGLSNMRYIFDTLERILEHCVIIPMKKTDHDISAHNLNCDTWKGRFNRITEILLHHRRNSTGDSITLKFTNACFAGRTETLLLELENVYPDLRSLPTWL